MAENNELNLNDLSVDEIESLLKEIEGVEPAPVSEPEPEQKQSPEPEPAPASEPEPQLMQPVVQPNTVDVDEKKLLETLASMSDEELTRWALENGPEGVAVLQKVQGLKILQEVRKQQMDEKVRHLQDIAQKWFSSLGLDLKNPEQKSLFDRIRRYADGLIMEKGGLQALSPSQLQEILEEAKSVFLPAKEQTQVADRLPSPTDLAGSSPQPKLDLKSLTPDQLEKLLEKYEPEDLIT